jgi:phosphoserine phosphatase RsbU/P
MRQHPSSFLSSAVRSLCAPSEGARNAAGSGGPIRRVSQRFGMRPLHIGLVVALTTAAAGCAQTVLPWEQGLRPLDSGWRAHAGNDPSWAARDFDDSLWTPSALGESHTPAPGANDERWYRLRIDLPAQHPPLALFELGGEGTYEVYLNGRLLPGARLRSAWGSNWRPTARAVPIEDTTGGLGSGLTVLAVHTRVPNTSLFHIGIGSIGPSVSIGTPAAIEDAALARQSERLRSRVLHFAVAILLTLAAIPLVLLSRLQRNHREYLWLGLNLLCLAYVNIAPNPAFFVFLELPAIYLAPITQIEFAFSFAGRPVTRIWRIYQGVIVLAIFTLLPLLWIGALNFYPYQAIEAALLIPAMSILPVLLFVWYRQGNREAGWLIVPSLFPLLSICVIDLGLIGLWLGVRPLAALVNPIPVGPFTVGFPEPANLLYLFAIGIVIFQRFNRVSHQQARAAAEWEAARTVQQVLIPADVPFVDGFRIEMVYEPASEVGGDFYQIAPTGDGGVLVVIGDVSGKGMPAAMTVSLLVGTFRTLAHYTQRPGEILAAMNERMVGRSDGGFTTCLVIRIDGDGAMTAANAGHLAPYLDGREITLDNDLPLGLSPDAHYIETSLSLPPGAQLTLMTDGVIEARSAEGELFGFERAAAASTDPAEEIAHAAQRFGQQDDITVLTVRLTSAEVALA